MRALLIGLGGAGCRIVNTINKHDEKSNVRSVRSYIFDADVSTVQSTASIEVNHRVVLSPSDPLTKSYTGGNDFDLTNITDCFQMEGFGEIDGIFICAGLGGRMADLVPRFIEQVETAFSDPVFTILTIPCRAEGVKVSTRAAEQLEAIRAVGSSSIIFDNETWSAKIESERSSTGALNEKNGFASATNSSSKKDTSDSHASSRASRNDVTIYYDDLNEMVARRVGLLLRAGEITHNGVESAEVVLDAGEVLNTLTGMDIVSIGYSTEKLPANFTGLFKKLFYEKYLFDEGHQRTSRIIDLAKKAVYEEVSVPCDLTSAEKALVLIAGPSEELSMKGFQMVRKWIDNSIRGLEMRAGDYPVKSTKYVGVIIVLAGIQNVPRIAELEEIRESYYLEMQKNYGFEEEVEEVPLLAVASDDTIFEPEDALPPAEYRYALAESTDGESMGEYDYYMETDDTGDDTMSYENYDDDDIFEDAQPINTRNETKYSDSKHFDSKYSDSKYSESGYGAQAPKKQQPRKRDPQISLGGAKRAEAKKTESISLPKREKKDDMVLAGMADLGKRTRPRDSESAVHVGGIKKPKDNDDVRIAQVQRPKDSDGKISAGSNQRPKDDDGGISAGSNQRPKDDDGRIHVTKVPMPKDDSGRVRMSSKKKADAEDKDTRSEFKWL